MKKLFLPLIALAAVAFLTVSLSSCKRELSDRFVYQAANDSIPPVIAISVPAMNQTYAYGNHVAIVGTISDLESEKNDIHDPGFRKGELSEITIEVDNLDDGTKLLKRNPIVNGIDGYGFNERVEIISGTGITKCRLIITASDASTAGYTVRDTVLFNYQ